MKTPALPGQPMCSDEPVFREPWEAHAFAMAVTLHQRGLFTWTEWAAALAAQITKAQAMGDADRDGRISVSDGVNVLRSAAALPGFGAAHRQALVLAQLLGLLAEIMAVGLVDKGDSAIG